MILVIAASFHSNEVRMSKTLDLHALKVKGSVLGPCALMTGDIWGGDEDFSRRGSAERVHHAGRGLFLIANLSLLLVMQLFP